MNLFDMRWSFVIFCCVIVLINSQEEKTSVSRSQTSIQTKNVTSASIDYKILGKPHHLFVGRCKPEHQILHQENIILVNDGKSQILAAIRTNVEGPVNITCVNIYDEVRNGEGGYPSFLGGGVGYNFIEFNVMTDYGKGFHFFVQIYGVRVNKDDKKENFDSNNNNTTTTVDSLRKTDNHTLDSDYAKPVNRKNYRRRFEKT